MLSSHPPFFWHMLCCDLLALLLTSHFQEFEWQVTELISFMSFRLLAPELLLWEQQLSPLELMMFVAFRRSVMKNNQRNLLVFTINFSANQRQTETVRKKKRSEESLYKILNCRVNKRSKSLFIINSV